MPDKRLWSFLYGYRRIGLAVLSLLTVAGAIVVTAIVIVWPLWFVATQARVVYTGAGAALLVGLIVFWMIRRRRHRRTLPASERAPGRRRRLTNAGLLLGVIACVYAGALLVARELVLPALVPVVVALGLIGLLGAQKDSGGWNA